MNDTQPAIALTIAGSDSGGGAGLQADLRAFQAAGVYGLSAVTAVTAQNSAEVVDIFSLPPMQVKAQIQAVIQDMPPAATKTGMLATPAIIKQVAALAASRKLGRLVVDPVLVSSSGRSLAEEGLERDLAVDLMPLADLVTPNIQEAQQLSGVEILSAHDSEEACLAFTEMNVRAICITGGHLDGDPVDILFDGRDFHQLRGTRIGAPGTRFHGAGCLFSASVTAYLARGMEIVAAVTAAKQVVEAALASAIRPGAGMSVPWLAPRPGSGPAEPA